MYYLYIIDRLKTVFLLLLLLLFFILFCVFDLSFGAVLITLISASVAEWPPFGKELST